MELNEHSENSDFIVMSGIKEVLSAKPSSVHENIKTFLAVKESLYSSITPIMKIIIEIIGSDCEEYLSRLNSENEKHNMRDIYTNFKNMNRKRVDRRLDHLQNTVVNTLLSLLQQLDQVFLESQSNSNLLLQLLAYFSKYWQKRNLDGQELYNSGESDDNGDEQQSESDDCLLLSSSAFLEFLKLAGFLLHCEL